MCDNPYLIKNPNYGFSSLGFKDVESAYLKIPCGHCPVCLHLKQEYFIQRFQMECLSNDLWTGMLSYNEEMLPRAMINGYNHAFADSRDVQLLTRRLRNDKVFNGPFKYWFISERGTKGKRPHWHFLISTPKIPNEILPQKLSREHKYWHAVLDNWYYNAGSRRSPIKVPLLTYRRCGKFRNYDFHYVNPNLSRNGSDDVGFYTSKYYLKDDKFSQRLRSALRLNLDEFSYEVWWHFLKNKHLSSHYLGDYRSPEVRSYILDCIDFSKRVRSPYPLFVNPNTGQTFPLSPYYRNKLCSVADMQVFYFNSNNVCNGVHLDDLIDPQDIVNRSDHFRKITHLLNSQDIDYQSLLNNSFNYDSERNFDEDPRLDQAETPLVEDTSFDCYDFDSDRFLL